MSPYKTILGLSIATAIWLSGPLRDLSIATILSIFHNVLLLSMLQLLVVGLWYWLVYPKLLSPLRHLPEPKGGSFFMGQFVLAGLGRTADPMRQWVNEVPNDGIILFHDILNFERVLVVSPKALAEVLVHKAYDFKKPPQVAKLLGRIFGIGVLLAEGHDHKIQRKNLQPAFSFRHIKELYPLFWAKSKELVATVNASEASDRNDDDHGLAGLDLNEWASRATLDIIGVAGFGEDLGALGDPGNKLSQTYKNIFNISKGSGMLTRIMRFVLPTWVYTNLPIKRDKNMNDAATTVRTTSLDLVRRAKQRLEEGKKENSIVSIALSSHAFAENEMVNQNDDVLPRWPRNHGICIRLGDLRLREEVYTKLPGSRQPESHVTSDDIEHLPYLNAFCNEVLRLYPPVTLSMRVAAVDTSILGQPIPKGTHILAAPWATNTSKELWGENAFEFDPDRWLKSNMGGAESNYSFLTFFHGPRSCIGQNFAQGELKCLVAAWVGAFETGFVRDDYVIQVQNGITAKPKDLRVKVKAVSL